VNPPDLSRDPRVQFKLCPAHEMLRNKQYEGEVIIRNVPAEFRQELLNLIENMGSRAMRRDILDRVLASRATGSLIRVTTSENQLAQRIAEKIRQVCKGRVTMRIARGEGGEVMRAEVDFFVKKPETV